VTRKGWTRGTHRAVAPEETLRRIGPLLARFGITRAAEVTGLDELGIPVFCAIRPRGVLLQVSNGKGLRPVDARVSALMEAIELAHAENPPPLRVARHPEIAREGEALTARELPWFRGDPALAEHLRMHWVRGEALPSRAPVWLPACAAWSLEPTFVAWSTNGLASGNTVDEATLHALLEVYERHTLSLLIDEAGDLDFAGMQCLDLGQAPGDGLAELRGRVEAAGLRVVLLRVAMESPLHSMMAVLLDPRAFATSSTVSFGSGAHVSPEVAASRAITEAAQSRLTFIHGSREDLAPRAYQDPAHKQRLYDFFSGFTPDTPWTELADASTGEIEADLAAILATMADEGLGPFHRVIMSEPELPIAVVKVLVGEAKIEFMQRVG